MATSTTVGTIINARARSADARVSLFTYWYRNSAYSGGWARMNSQLASATVTLQPASTAACSVTLHTIHSAITTVIATKACCPGKRGRAPDQPPTASKPAAMALRRAMSGVACHAVSTQASRSGAGVMGHCSLRGPAPV
jgi:hypothetical protein